MSRLAKIRFVVAALIVITLIAASALRSFGLFLDDIYWLQERFGGDKVVHCAMGIALMTASLLVFLPKSFWSTSALLLLTIGVLSLEEISQMPSATRELDPLDLVAGSAGALLLTSVFAAGLSVRRYMNRPGDRRQESTRAS